MITLDRHFVIVPNDYNEAGKASSELKRTLKRMGFSRDLIKRVSVASYEAEINIVIHSLGGTADFKIIDDVIYLQFIDCGPGIPDIDLAMQEGYSTANEISRLNGFGAGMGLKNIKKAADDMILVSDCNGTVLKLKFYIREEDKDVG
jgi:anti-sigma regulatory factor (Ser/Thr protein kinase)